MTRVYLARHGETDWNALGKLQGRTDIPLNYVGVAQATALAKRLEGTGIASVVTSDLSRAAVTGSIVANALGIAVPIVDEELRERCFGVFEGLTREECAERHPLAWQAWLEQTSPPEGAEARELVTARMTRSLVRAAASAGSGAALVVSHGGAMRLWLVELLQQPMPPVANTTVYLVEFDGAAFSANLWQP